MPYTEARNLRMIMLGEAIWLERFTVNIATTGDSQDFACYILDDRYNTLYVVRNVQEWRKDKEAIRANIAKVSLQVA